MINLSKYYGRKLWPPYLSYYFFYPLQPAVIINCYAAITVSMISILSNSAQGAKNFENSKAAYILMLCYAIVNIIGLFIIFIAAFRMHVKLMYVGLGIFSSATLVWVILAIMAFFPKSNFKITCISGKCAETQWICETRWQYSKIDCPFMKEKLELHWPMWKENLFYEQPRDEEYKLTTQPEQIFADYLDVVDDYGEQEALRYLPKLKDSQSVDISKFLTDYKAYYKGCEANDPELITISLILFLVYLFFCLHLVWLVLSYIHEVESMR